MCPQPERAAVNGDAFHVSNNQAMAPKEAIQRGEGEIAEMLVITGVELAMINEI